MGDYAVVEQAMATIKKTTEHVSNGQTLALDLAKKYFAFSKDLSESKEAAYHDVLLQFVTIERDVKQYMEVIQETMNQLQGADDADVQAIVDAKFAEKQRRNNSIDLELHPKLVELADEVAARRDDAPAQEQHIVDDDLQMTVDAVQTKCPYTGREMVNPVKNKHCSHTYDKEGILEYIRQKGRKAKCPVGGCPNTHPLADVDLVENKEVRRHIDRLRKAALHAQKKDRHGD